MDVAVGSLIYMNSDLQENMCPGKQRLVLSSGNLEL